MPKISIITTGDGSQSLFNEDIQQSYKSTNGAMSESMYVFIKSGLEYFDKKELSIFEVGFGSGLNTLLTCLEAQKKQIKVNYSSIELFPVDLEIIENIEIENKDLFLKLHQSRWNEDIQINDFFTLNKINADLTSYKFDKKYDLIYFDAFSYEKQPQMWSEEIFENIYKSLYEGGILVTYSSKGVVKQNLRKAGFEVHRLKGFMKHHIIRAIKKVNDNF